MKRCSRCKNTKPLSEFNKNQSNKDGLRSCCKECKKTTDKKYRQNHKEERQQYTQQHKIDFQQYQKQYYKTLRGHLYRIWKGMIYRCNDSKRPDYKYYGGRGIKVKFKLFKDFYNYVVNELKADPRGLTIDRIDNDGDYKRGNIRFVSQAENNLNKRKYALKG